MKNVRHVIAIGSCKGGVGKTTVAVNLAMALRRTGSKVGLFDADLYGPNVPLMLGVRNRSERLPFSLRRKGGKSVAFIPLYDRRPASIAPIRKYGLEVMSLGFWFGEQTSAKDTSFLGGRLVAQVLESVTWGGLDYLIIDLPPGTGEFLRMVVSAARADGVILVTTPQEMTLLDTGRSIDFFRSLDVDIAGRIENMSYLICPNCGSRIEIYTTSYDDWQVIRDLPLIGTIPLDAAYAKPIDAYHPFTQLSIGTALAAPYVEVANQVRERFR